MIYMVHNAQRLLGAYTPMFTTTLLFSHTFCGNRLFMINIAYRIRNTRFICTSLRKISHSQFSGQLVNDFCVHELILDQPQRSSSVRKNLCSTHSHEGIVTAEMGSVV